jgi:4-amino-4-deoxy-L-arabinose transferase-like glycosyltransferase
MTTTASPESAAFSRLSGVITPAFAPMSLLNAVRARVVLGAICVLAGVLYGWGMWVSGWGNPYYSAAVKSMSVNFTNFVFGSFDPVGVVTVDKPPMAFWPMVVSAAVFGYHGWSLLLPQVIEGVAAVFLLHRAVRRWAGEHVALLAALIFALTPVTVAINRDTNPDTLMVLLLVAAAYALTRSVQPGIKPGRATRWLLLAAMLLGLGFVTKMLQAWIVVPAFALAYLVGSAAPVRRRALDLIGAGAVLLAGSLWWVALVSFWPAPKPYIGGSTDGSVLNLVIGYNGLGRILGRETGRALVSGAPGGRPWTGGGGFGGTPGITRLFGAQVGGQISWLLPLSLLILISVTIAGVRQLRSGTRGGRAGWLLWGGWLLLVGVVLSVARGGFHPYYTTEMAPAVAAVTAAGVATMWRRYRSSGGYQWLVFPAAVMLTAMWAWVLVSRDLSWHGWLRDAVAGVAVVAVLLLVAARVWVSRTSRLAPARVARAAGALGVVALLLAPGVWVAATAFASSGGAMAQAGPSRSAFGPGRFGPARRDLPAQLRGRMAGDLTADQRKILSYAVANSGGAPITLAVQGGAMAAEPFLIHSDAAIVGMGGFSGQDPAPTVATLAQWVQQGRLRFVLAGGEFAGRQGRGGVSAQRTQWVQQHCAVVDPASYGAAGRTETFYDCRGAP